MRHPISPDHHMSEQPSLEMDHLHLPQGHSHDLFFPQTPQESSFERQKFFEAAYAPMLSVSIFHFAFESLKV